MRPLPVEGDAEEVLAISQGLRAQATQLAAVTRALQGVARSAAGDWDSPAGAVFAARAAAVLPVLSRITTRYAAASAAVRPVAEALHSAQASSREALAEWDDAWPRFLAAGEAMARAQADSDPVSRARAEGHRAVMLAQHERCTAAQYRNDAAHTLWREADRRCAAVLHRLLHDGLADPWAYDVLSATSREAHGADEAVRTLGPVTMLPPFEWLAAVGTAGEVVALGADAALLVGYGQGRVGALGLRAASLATAPVAGVLKRGATATNPLSRLGTPVRTRAEARARLPLSTGGRVKAGLRGEWDHVVRGVPDPPPRHRVPPSRLPRTPRDAAAWARTQAYARARVQVQNAWLDDWALAGRGGTAARRMLVSAWVLDKAADPLADGADALEGRSRQPER